MSKMLEEEKFFSLLRQNHARIMSDADVKVERSDEDVARDLLPRRFSYTRRAFSVENLICDQERGPRYRSGAESDRAAIECNVSDDEHIFFKVVTPDVRGSQRGNTIPLPTAITRTPFICCTRRTGMIDGQARFADRATVL